MPDCASISWTWVFTGAIHTCGLRGKGDLWCWGDNQRGQLGDGAAVTSGWRYNIGYGHLLSPSASTCTGARGSPSKECSESASHSGGVFYVGGTTAFGGAI